MIGAIKVFMLLAVCSLNIPWLTLTFHKYTAFFLEFSEGRVVDGTDWWVGLQTRAKNFEQFIPSIF